MVAPQAYIPLSIRGISTAMFIDAPPCACNNWRIPQEGGKLLTFFGILALVIGCIAGVVTLSYTLVWYEYANRDPELMTHRFALRRMAFALFLIATETVCIFSAILLQPLGWFNWKEKPPTASPRPVIMLHGLFHSRACWIWLKLALRRRGFSTLHTLKLPPWKDVEILTEELAKKVDEFRHATGLEKVDLICHSMGGIIARNYLQLRGGGNKVDRCILLATPNQGSKLAPFTVTSLGGLLMPGSSFLQRLGAAPLPENARIFNLFSHHDNMVVPFEHACLEGARNIELSCCGHTALLFRPDIPKIVAGLLKE
jgi:triacylglycerol lipase